MSASMFEKENGTNHLAFTADERIFLGEGLFETLKVVEGKPCFAKLHWQRIRDAAEKLAIPFPCSEEEWLEWLQQKILQNQLIDGGIKVILTGGSASRGLAACTQQSTLIAHTFVYTPLTQPLRLMSAPWLRDAANPIYQVKSINYLEAILARRQALTQGFDDVLFFNMQQHATESSCANIFLIHQGQLLTPPIQDGVLAGITRSRILIHYKEICQEVSFTRELLAQAGAVFLTNALQGLQCVQSLDELKFKRAHPLIEKITSFLQHDF